MSDFSEPITKIFKCKCCDFETRKKARWDRHLQTQKHILSAKRIRYSCETCNYYTSNKTDYTKHLLTNKHKNKTSLDNEDDANPNNEDPHLLKELIAEQNDYFEKRLEQSLERGLERGLERIGQQQLLNMAQNNTTNNTTNNMTINNNHFNLNFFLNEKCKDAMNIEDFINSLEVCPFDVAETGRLGYVEGISRIFMNKLNQLDIYNRPLHCTDLKRETLYIKEDNKWEKDNEQNDKLQSIVEQVANRNYELLPIWQQQNPNHLVTNSTECELFMDIACNILGGGNEQESSKFRNQIMRNVLKEVTISKDVM